MPGFSLSLDGKVALITGGSRGIGAETVRLFAEAGARVAFSYRQARERAEDLAGECGTTSKGWGHCVPIQQELQTPADGRALVEATVAAFGRLDILVANHGIWESEDVPIVRMTEAQWRRTLAVNLDSVFGLVQAAAAQMERQSAAGVTQPGAATGHIVLISSTAGQRGEANHADYAVTKGAIIISPRACRASWRLRGFGSTAWRRAG